MVCALFFWFFFGWLADYSFPFGQALELMLACFRGTISAKINSLQQQLQRTDIISQPDNKQQVQKLNNLESQAWLYEGILERLGAESSANHENIARTIEALEYKRSEILQELEPRKPRKYRFLAGLQNYIRSFLASQAEKDYEELQKIATNLVIFARNRPASQLILSEVIDKLATEIAQNSNKISPYRLRLAYRVDEVMRIISTKLVFVNNTSITDSNYQLIINDLNYRLSRLSEEFNNLLTERQNNKNDLDSRVNEINNISKNISNLHREISNRDADIVVLQENLQNLTKTVQDKQSKINNLQNIISDLRTNVRNTTDFNQEKENTINNIQNQLSLLKQEKSELNMRIQELSTRIQSKGSEIEELQHENSRLNTEKSELEQRYQTLHHNYQKQNDEIAIFRAQIVQAEGRKKQQIQKTNNRIATEKEISVEEYEKISNQSDYVYVKSYYRKNGTYVKAYYRRPPNR
ncbi:hypothetical protein [Mastigocoleus sp. MO_188.B34]|uniref:hypothetical protein n=1 Tax=Mastigocoleus sp. MO_188.B34 TaxID=3036635 RepID=UPI002623F5DC|nr:hypothetical protein [Mastigocoleus sp. MO_188.B34]MDJ0696451.1 hypothetical protein [Mastigocoleus sp. MO_188.B34]